MLNFCEVYVLLDPTKFYHCNFQETLISLKASSPFVAFFHLFYAVLIILGMQ